MRKDKQKYLENNSWMFRPCIQTLSNNQQLQLESDNKLHNMIEGKTNTGNLQFAPSEAMNPFMMNIHTPAIQSYEEVGLGEGRQKEILTDNTRLPKFMMPKTRPTATLGKRQTSLTGDHAPVYDPLSTPALLGIHHSKDSHYDDPSVLKPHQSSFDLKALLGEQNHHSDDEDGPGATGTGPRGLSLHKFPSASPSQLGSPIMTWGCLETEAVRIGPVTQREVTPVNPREQIAHQLTSKLMEKHKVKEKKREEQLQKILTPYAKQGSVLLSQISSKLLSRKQTSQIRPASQLPGVYGTTPRTPSLHKG